MPIQGPQWTEFLTCPICLWEFNRDRGPVSLSCGHTICKTCLQELHRKRCPFDQSVIGLDLDQLPLNWALLQLVTAGDVKRPVSISTALPQHEHQAYSTAIQCIEELALFLKPLPAASGGGAGGGPSVLSRSMQRKLVTIVTCQLLEQEGRSRVLRACRSLGERTVTELILHHQNPAQLSANLWAAVRARGCQFLGPAMQEEVLRLVLLALEEGHALSRKVLVMFVVQRLEPHFPQASKTSIGHVVQLLYRASCFKVTKREGDSSLMQLKDEFRTYEALRREHDAQIVQIALEAGLRIAPDQWSSLLYGDVAHKSHMQSIMDKLQSPSSFNQSIQELIISLQKTGDPAGLSRTRPHFQTLAAVDPSPETLETSWEEVVTALQAAREVVRVLISFVQHHGSRRPHVDNTHAHSAKYKTSLCRDLKQRGTCPRGPACTFAHSEEELERYRAKSRRSKKPPDRQAGLSALDPLQLAASDSVVGLQPRQAAPPPPSPFPQAPPTFQAVIPQRVVQLPVAQLPAGHVVRAAVARVPYQLELYAPAGEPPSPGQPPLIAAPPPPTPAAAVAVPPPAALPVALPPAVAPAAVYGAARALNVQSPPRAVTSLSSSGLQLSGSVGSFSSAGEPPQSGEMALTEDLPSPPVSLSVTPSSIASRSLVALRQRKQEILMQLETMNSTNGGGGGPSPVPASEEPAVHSSHYSIWTSSDGLINALKSSLASYQNTKSRGTDSAPVYSNVRVAGNTEDDEYIPFSSASESKYGPISRMARSVTTLSKPVQVSALNGSTMPTEAVTQPVPLPGHIIPPTFMQICDPYMYSAPAGVQYRYVAADGGLSYNTIGHGVIDPPGLRMWRLKPSGDRPSDPLPLSHHQEGSRLAAESIRLHTELETLERRMQDVQLVDGDGPSEGAAVQNGGTPGPAPEAVPSSVTPRPHQQEKNLIRELWLIEHGIQEKRDETRLYTGTGGLMDGYHQQQLGVAASHPASFSNSAASAAAASSSPVCYSTDTWPTGHVYTPHIQETPEEDYSKWSYSGTVGYN